MTRALHAGTPFANLKTHEMMTELPDGKDSNYQFGLGIVTQQLGGEAEVGVGRGGGTCTARGVDQRGRALGH